MIKENILVYKEYRIPPMKYRADQTRQFIKCIAYVGINVNEIHKYLRNVTRVEKDR